MDGVKLNAAYNTLKQAVGENGCFVLLCVSPKKDSQEGRTIFSHGSVVMTLGILGSMAPILQDKLEKRLEESLKEGLRPPD